MKKSREKLFSELMSIMYKLREECPWDKKQTAESLRQYLLEETYEVLETIDQKRWTDLGKELGDLLLQIVFQSVIAEENKRFTIEDILSNIISKLVERHPHVYGDVEVESDKDVTRNWEYIKMKSENRNSLISGIPAETPALLYAQRMQEKVSKVGFDWKNSEDVVKKIDEEVDELKIALKKGNSQEINEEIGDILFSIVNVSRFLNTNAEDCLREANSKFKKRFHFIEDHYNGDFELMKKTSLKEMDALWEKAKR